MFASSKRLATVAARLRLSTPKQTATCLFSTDRKDHPYLTGQARYMPGFSFPAPRALSQIIQYALLEREQPDQIEMIWNQFHEDRNDSVATTLTRAHPQFIYPVRKGDGKFFMLFAQWQDNYCIFTFLDDYRRNPSTAEPYLALTMFDDFLDRKELVLVRGDFSGHLVKPEANKILDLMQYFYLKEPHWLETFNTNPSAFDFNRYLAECP